MTLGTDKLEWRGYPTVQKFETYTNVTQTDGRTDGQTPHNSAYA